MELECESSTLESVEVKQVRDDMYETMIDLNKQETSSPVSKGFGLRKWRRLKRRDLVKNLSVNMENSKILKRVLSGTADLNPKQMHFQSPDVQQDSLGSVGSVNNMVGFGIAGTSHGTSLAFSVGLDSDNSEDRSSRSSTAASCPKVSRDKERSKYLGGKSLIGSVDNGQERKTSVEKSDKLRGEKIKIDKENSHSSMESADSRSSNFVFMQGDSLSVNSREYNMGEGETKNYSQGDSAIKNNGSSDNLDPLTKAFNSFQNLQEALQRELQKFQELGKESISLLHYGAESSSYIHAGEASSSRPFGSENLGELRLTCLDSEILNLVNDVEHLEIKQEETKRILEVKESQISELESNIRLSEPYNRGTEIEMEDIFQQKIEAEIEYLIFSRSVANLKRRIKVIEEEKLLAENEAHKMLSKLGEAETKAENLKNQAQNLQNHFVEIQEEKSFKKRVFKTTSCLLIQLGLLFMLFNFQLMPELETVVPT